MASDLSNADVNGGIPKSRAAMLEEQHARDEAHKPTVEDVVDEEDLKHPPPSSLVQDQKVDVPAQSPAPTEAPASKAVPKKAPAFDVQSEELFPALGSGPKPKAPAASAWGARGPSAAAAVSNGVPGGSPAGKFLSTHSRTPGHD